MLGGAAVRVIVRGPRPGAVVVAGAPAGLDGLLRSPWRWLVRRCVLAVEDDAAAAAELAARHGLARRPVTLGHGGVRRCDLLDRVAAGDGGVRMRALAGWAPVARLERALVRGAAWRRLESAGEPTAARAAAPAVAVASRRRLTGALRVHDPAWRPAAGRARAPAASAPRDGRASPPRVLWLLEASLPHAVAGYAVRSAALLDAVRRSGFEPVAATRLGFPASRGTGGWAIVEAVGGISHHRLWLPGVRRYSAVPPDAALEAGLRVLTRLVERVRPQLLVAATPHLNGLLGLALRHRFGIPLVYDVRGFPELTWAAEHPDRPRAEVAVLRREAETRCMREADAVLTQSGIMRAEVLARGVAAGRVHVVPHAVDTEAFAPRPRDPALPPTVGYASSLRPYEGIETLLRALVELRGRRPAVRGLIVGDGPDRERLTALAAELGLEAAVRFAGHVGHGAMPAVYAGIDVFAVPRDDLPLTRLVTPLKPVEAMAAGCCIALADLPALMELGADTAATFLSGDPAGLAATLDRLLASDGERARLGRAARERAVREHGREAGARALAAALRGLPG